MQSDVGHPLRGPAFTQFLFDELKLCSDLFSHSGVPQNLCCLMCNTLGCYITLYELRYHLLPHHDICQADALYLYQYSANEIRYGSSNKDVFIVTPLGEDPFTEFDITARFKTIEDLIEYSKQE